MEKISAKELYKKLQIEKISLIDVRESDEFASGHVPGAHNLPLSSLSENYSHLDKDIHYHVIGQKGGRSPRPRKFLDARGYKVTNVKGGLEAYPESLTK